MIISASRRSDIPAFASSWFNTCLDKGCVDVVNPYNSRQVRQVSLEKEDVDLFVFWTRNASPFLDTLEHLTSRGYPWFMQYTLNGYGASLEPGVPSVIDAVQTIETISARYGIGKIIWRYDPIFISQEFSISYHVDTFGTLCEKLKNSAERGVISFLDIYRKNRKLCREMGIRSPDRDEIEQIARQFGQTASEYGVRIQTCAEEYDLSGYGILQGGCIDEESVLRFTETRIPLAKDRNQRPHCRCLSSVDIGSYGTCRYGCRYCYAR